MHVKVDGKPKVLEGEHHIVSKDFIRVFRQNQDTTLAAMEQLDFYKSRVVPIAAGGSFLLGITVTILIMRIVRPKG